MSVEPPVKLNRFGVWLCVYIALIGLLLYGFTRVERQAEATSLEVTMQRVLDMANSYKHYWHLNGEPSYALVDGKPVYFSERGWVLPYQVAPKAGAWQDATRDEVDCGYWLSLLYPSTTVYGSDVKQIEQQQSRGVVECRYQFAHQHWMTLRIKNSYFEIEINS